MSADLLFSFAWVIPLAYFLASLILFVLLVRVLLVLHTYLTLKVQRERMGRPPQLEE